MQCSSILKPYIDRLFTLPDLKYPALRDYILSMGELLSAVLFASAVSGKVIPGEEIFVGKSRRNAKLIYEALEEGLVPVISGFMANLSDKVATLGRE